MPHGDMTVGINNMFFVEDVIGGYEGFVSLFVVLVRGSTGESEFPSCLYLLQYLVICRLAGSFFVFLACHYGLGYMCRTCVQMLQ